ncbi:MAG: MFS transporter [Synergistetes bacterium]|nr:MFS transporter [Synergistota bacterium]MCX8128296.1 MFS transporter [Synergistota bacterium]MDW8192610.1 MFS transporter [Synergistota bacterium]
MLHSRWVVLISTLLIMFCIGGVYAWSAFAYELIKGGYFSVTQSQIVFSSISGGIPFYMILAGRLEQKVRRLKKVVLLTGILFGISYILAGLFNGNFWGVWLSLGFLSAIGIGILYALGIGIPIRWFPAHRKGLVAGLAVGSFGLGSVVLPFIIMYFKGLGYSVHQIFIIVGVIYLSVISVSAIFFDRPNDPEGSLSGEGISVKIKFFNQWCFWRLWLGIFCGVFGGVTIIGNLKNIGLTLINDEFLVTASISLFAITNCIGRVLWGFIGDRIGSPRAIVLSMLCGALALIGLYTLSISAIIYVLLIFLLGFSYGANFVLFARETAECYGINKVTLIYPYVFLGNALAAICGPIIGGILYDLSGGYYKVILVAFFVNLLGVSFFAKDVLRLILSLIKHLGFCKGG